MSRRLALFDDLAHEMGMIEPSLEPNIRCPICWTEFSRAQARNGELTIEDIVPKKAMVITGETASLTLTCRRCNNSLGSKYYRDMVRMLEHQSSAAAGTLTFKSAEFAWGDLPPLRGDITFSSGSVSMIGVPRINDPRVTQSYVGGDDGQLPSDSKQFKLEGNFGFRVGAVWLGYLMSAYLSVFQQTHGAYGYTNAGRLICRLISARDIDHAPRCVINVDAKKWGKPGWVARLTAPHDLRCYWVMVAGNLVILPLLGDDGSVWRAWEKKCESTTTGLAPKNLKFTVNFPDKAAMRRAAQVLGLDFAS